MVALYGVVIQNDKYRKNYPEYMTCAWIILFMRQLGGIISQSVGLHRKN
jgi:hypothetical protein